MDRKRLAKLVPHFAGAALCLSAALKLAFQFQATDEKDVASGHVEPIMFAPRIGADWDYITHPQMVALAVVLTAVMLLGAAALTSRWWSRDRAAVPAADLPDDAVADPPAAPPHQPPPGRRPFGRAKH
jgi:hypothetical protein